MSKMDYANQVAKLLAERLNVNAEVKEIKKNNGVTKVAVLVKEFDSDSIPAPMFYIDHAYEEQVEINDVVNAFAEKYEETRRRDIGIEPADDITSFENVKDKIVFNLVNYKANEELFSEVPYKKYLDFAIIYRIQLTDEASTRINYNLMDTWGIDLKTLDRVARKNTLNINPVEFKTMTEILGLPKEMHDEFPAYILTNANETNGASVIKYKGILKKVANELDDDLILIPSSIHEWIVLAKNAQDKSMGDLSGLIQSVNAAEVVPEEQLSDHPYYYNRETGRLRMTA